MARTLKEIEAAKETASLREELRVAYEWHADAMSDLSDILQQLFEVQERVSALERLVL
jgi:Tfp pilus assembly protein PilO